MLAGFHECGTKTGQKKRNSRFVDVVVVTLVFSLGFGSIIIGETGDNTRNDNGRFIDFGFTE